MIRLRLSRHAKSVVGSIGAALIAAAFALLPTYARSAAGAAFPEISSTLPPELRAVLNDVPARLSQIGVDPFARGLGDDRSPAPPSRVRADRKPVGDARNLRLLAASTGDVPHALLDDGRSTLIVGVGDAVGETRVVAIDGDGVLLQDGRRLRVAGIEP